MNKQKQERINNIKRLRACQREVRYMEGQWGVLIITGDKEGVFCNPDTGVLRPARVNKDGLWVLWGYAMGRPCGKYKEYLKSVMPGLNINIRNHIVVAVALGWFDNDENLIYDVNHKNYTGTDNRKVNLELCTERENSKHRDFRKVIIDIGLSRGETIWVDGMTIEALNATYIMDNSKNYVHNLLEGFRRFVYMNY